MRLQTAEQAWFQERGPFEYFLIGHCPVFAVLVNTPAYILSIILLERRTPSDLTKTAFEKAFKGIYCERTIPKLHMCYFQYHHQLSILVKAMPGLVKGLQGVGWVIRESRPHQHHHRYSHSYSSLPSSSRTCCYDHHQYHHLSS